MPRLQHLRRRHNCCRDLAPAQSHSRHPRPATSSWSAARTPCDPNPSTQGHTTLTHPWLPPLLMLTPVPRLPPASYGQAPAPAPRPRLEWAPASEPPLPLPVPQRRVDWPLALPGEGSCCSS
uniref:Uncharacterized protein n=1 Tax=Arundo donax TaxID=35708 RepID=A0A0A9F031_ARUDO